MARRLKTIEYYGTLPTLTDNVFTAFPNFTISIPEAATGSGIIFRSCFVESEWGEEAAQAGSNITDRAVRIRLQGGTYTTITNTNLVTNSGESAFPTFSADVTARFTADWGTNLTRTCDIELDIDSAATTPLMRNASFRLVITYEYDDTSTTQTKTVFLAMDAPLGAIPTVKTAVYTINALDTFLPETSKVYRNISIIVQGNFNNTTGGTTDSTLSQEIDSLGVFTSGTFEAGQTSDRWIRWVYNATGVFTTNATHTWNFWGSVARFNHYQAYMVVTYDYNESTSITIFNSLRLPMEFTSPMGSAAATFQTDSRTIYIDEPALIVIKESALLIFWDQVAANNSIQTRIYTSTKPAFSGNYTDGAAVLCGGNGLMRKEPPAGGAMALARGKNMLVCDIYTTDAGDLGWNLSGLWILNYTSGKHANGSGVHNHTVIQNFLNHSTGASAQKNTSAAVAPVIPASEYFLSAIGIEYQYFTNSTGTAAGVSIKTERLVAEGGFNWEGAYLDASHTDAEQGIRTCYATARSVFKRWVGDDNNSRIDIETARRWLTSVPSASWDMLNLMLTYHSISFNKTQTITDSGGGTVTVEMYRKTNNEKVKTFSRTGNGTIPLLWFDDVETMYSEAREDATHMGRSDDFTFA
jgi:hypothetical protein